MCGVAVLAVAAVATPASSAHGHDLAIKRSIPNGKTDVIKA